MNDWIRYLESFDTHSSSLSTLPEERNLVCDLGNFGFLSVEGEDAATFLQGQLTNDVLALEQNQFQLSGYCTPKGRLLATFQLTKCSDTAFLMQMPKALLKSTQARLSMFVLNANVTISDVSESLVSIGIQSSDMSQMVPNWPTKPYDGSEADNLRIQSHPGLIPRAEIIATPAALVKFCEPFNAETRWQTPDFWIAANIRSGIPTIYESTSDAFTPQMVNLELADGVSFSKGCYPGQEIVARTQYLGKIKRRMHCATLDLTTPPSAGSLIVSDTEDTEVGTVIDAAHENGQIIVGFVAKSGAMDSVLYPQGSSGHALKLFELPYELDL